MKDAAQARRYSPVSRLAEELVYAEQDAIIPESGLDVEHGRLRGVQESGMRASRL